MMSNHYTFVVPMFNASATIMRMLCSVVGQSYENWKIILIDDVSSDEHKRQEVATIEAFKRLPGVNDKIVVIWNTEKKWEVANVLHGISRCSDDDIVCRLDADDALCDLDALAIIDAHYQYLNCDALWTAHRWGISDKNISGPMPSDADPYKYPWVSSHLKTFRKRLINDVPDVNFRGDDGQYVRRAGDQAIYLPILHNAKQRYFLPRVMYHYTINDVPETYQTPDAKFQKNEAEFLRQRGYVK